MEEQNKFWRNQVHVITAHEMQYFISELNEFYKDRFVIATQIWSPVQSGNKDWLAIVYFKVSPEDQEKAVTESKNERI